MKKKELLEAIEDTIIWFKRLFCQCKNKTVIKKWVYKEHTIYKMKCLNCGKIKFKKICA